EAVEIIKKLFAASLAGRDARHEGQYYKLESTRLWTMPDAAPPILIGTAGPVTAKRAGRTVDGIVVDGAPVEKVAPLLQRFAEGAREVGRRPETQTRIIRLHLSWAPTRDAAVAAALAEWPNAGMRFPKSDIRSPFELEQSAGTVRPEHFERRVLRSDDGAAHRRQ